MRFFYALSMLAFLFLAILHFAGCGGVDIRTAYFPVYPDAGQCAALGTEVGDAGTCCTGMVHTIDKAYAVCCAPSGVAGGPQYNNIDVQGDFDAVVNCCSEQYFYSDEGFPVCY